MILCTLVPNLFLKSAFVFFFKLLRNTYACIFNYIKYAVFARILLYTLSMSYIFVSDGLKYTTKPSEQPLMGKENGNFPLLNFNI